jgi:SAM-dependent methyltransferase
MKPENKWDQRFSEPGYAYGTEPNQFLVNSLKYLPDSGSILCLADGEGRNGVFLAQQGYEVTAVDSSVVGLEKAEALAREKGVKINTTVADLSDYPLALNTYDAIISIFCHLPPSVRQQLYSMIPGSLTPGGIFLLEGYTPRQLIHKTGGPQKIELLIEIAELQKELAPLNFIHAIELERDIQEGRLHTGIGAVAQLIAEKN